MSEKAKSSKKLTRIGTVVSDKPHKTISVSVDRLVLHPLFKKYIKRRTKFLVHDENNECRVGDKVKIMESAPISRHKRWRLVSVIEKKAALSNI